jgi:hypothetical protein
LVVVNNAIAVAIQITDTARLARVAINGGIALVRRHQIFGSLGTIDGVEFARNSVPDPKTGGVLDREPGLQNTRKLDDAEEYKQ